MQNSNSPKWRAKFNEQNMSYCLMIKCCANSANVFARRLL